MRRLVLLLTVVFVLAGAGGALAYRASGPRVEGASLTATIPVAVGQLLHASASIRSDQGVRIDGVEVVGAPAGATDVWVYRPGGGSDIGSYVRNSHAISPRFEPAVGQWIDDRHANLVVTFVAERPGTYRVSAVRVTYGSGLRRRTTTVPFGTCFIALEARPSGVPVEPCEPAPEDGIFFEL